MTAALVDFVTAPQWVAWRNEMRDGKLTKVPYVAPGRQAEADDPSTWLSHDQAVRISDAIVNGSGGGIGIELGRCGEVWLIGTDLDTCRDPASGTMEPWATEVIEHLNSYAEVSPSETGVKVFCLVDPTDLPELRRIMGTNHGRQFKRANGGKHPPAIEVYTSNRYFAVTWQGLVDAPTELRVVPLADLRWLIEQAGPALSGKADRKRDRTTRTDDASTVLGRLNISARHSKPIDTALRNAATMRGGSRSEGALGLGLALKRAGWTFADTKTALLACPATHEWATEADERQFERIWNHPSEEKPSDARGPNTLQCTTLDPVGKANIPPRPWAYGRFLLFGSAAVLGAVDGGGKGVIAVVIALAIITGLPLLGERVWRTGPVVIVSYEDDDDEWHRRIAAACEHYALDYKYVLANIHFLHKTGERISFATVVEGRTLFPDSDAIVEHLQAVKAAVLIVDPFNHAHALEDGNNNVMIAKVAAEMTRIATCTHVACLVLHHLRKGATGQIDDLMGATSLRATFRTCRILSRMAADVAESLKITEAWRYIRIAGSKENYAPPPDKATWYRLIGIPLGNGDQAYPDGDEVAVAIAWQPRPMFEGMDATALRAVFIALRQTIHGPNKQAKHTPWAGLPLIEIGGRTGSQAGKIIAAWLNNGVLIKETYYHEASKHNVEKVTLDDAKVTEILREIEVIVAPPE